MFLHLTNLRTRPKFNEFSLKNVCFHTLLNTGLTLFVNGFPTNERHTSGRNSRHIGQTDPCQIGRRASVLIPISTEGTVSVSLSDMVRPLRGQLIILRVSIYFVYVTGYLKFQGNYSNHMATSRYSIFNS